MRIEVKRPVAKNRHSFYLYKAVIILRSIYVLQVIARTSDRVLRI